VVATGEKIAGVNEGFTLTCNRTRCPAVANRTTTLPLVGVTFPLQTLLTNGEAVCADTPQVTKASVRMRMNRGNIPRVSSTLLLHS
jgi:hypothetical protein